MSATLIKQAPFAKESTKMLGTRASVATQGKILRLPKMSGLGLSYLKIEGSTVDGASTGDSGIEIRLSSKNLIDTKKLVELIEKYDTSLSGSQLVEVDGRRCILFYNHTLNAKDLTSCCPVFKEKTRYIFSFEIRPYTILAQGENYGGRIFIRYKPEKTEIASLNIYLNAYTTEFQRMYIVNKENTTITDIGFSYGTAYRWLIDLDSIYLYEYDGDENPSYTPPLIEKAVLPSIVALSDGTELQIALSQGESLEYIASNKSVIYHAKDKDYDLSSTDFARELCLIAGKYNTDYEIMVKSAIAPTAIKASYYSTIHEDKYELCISYECDGKSISEAKTYAVRAGSAYKIIAPHIMGYVPCTPQLQGVINANTEITINYKRKEN